VKKFYLTAVSAVSFLFMGFGVAHAQDDANEEVWTPVEAWTCNYRDGKGPGDLNKVIDEWNEWWDDKGLTSYFAATLTPYYFGEKSFDIGWLGAWSDGNAMGESLDVWMTDGAGVGAKFFEVIDCGSHTQFASLNVRQPEQNGDESDKDFLLSFANCSMKEGQSFEDYMAAQAEWNDYADEAGIKGGTWLMFPIAGESNNDYDFKHVVGEDDHSEAGANWAAYADGHYRKSQELFEPLVDCDIGRVYSATVVRDMESGED